MELCYTGKVVWRCCREPLPGHRLPRSPGFRPLVQEQRPPRPTLHKPCLCRSLVCGPTQGTGLGRLLPWWRTPFPPHVPPHPLKPKPAALRLQRQPRCPVDPLRCGVWAHLSDPLFCWCGCLRAPHAYAVRRIWCVWCQWELAAHGPQRVGKVIAPYVSSFLNGPRLTFFPVAWHPPGHQ